MRERERKARERGRLAAGGSLEYRPEVYRELCSGRQREETNGGGKRGERGKVPDYHLAVFKWAI